MGYVIVGKIRHGRNKVDTRVGGGGGGGLTDISSDYEIMLLPEYFQNYISFLTNKTKVHVFLLFIFVYVFDSEF